MNKNEKYIINNIVLNKDDKSIRVREKITNIHLHIGLIFEVIDIQKNIIIIKYDGSKYALSKEIFNYLEITNIGNQNTNIR